MSSRLFTRQKQKQIYLCIINFLIIFTGRICVPNFGYMHMPFYSCALFLLLDVCSNTVKIPYTVSNRSNEIDGLQADVGPIE